MTACDKGADVVVRCNKDICADTCGAVHFNLCTRIGRLNRFIHKGYVRMRFFVFFRNEQHKIFFGAFGFPYFNGNRFTLHIAGFIVLLLGTSAAARKSKKKHQ